MRSTRTAFAVAIAAASLGAAGCGSSGSGGSGGGTIKIGAISSLTGQLQFPETKDAAKAVFDDVNADGGIHGKKIEYVVEDDKGTPAVSAQAARRLVDQEGVVGLVGGTSLPGCAVNARFYAQKDVLSVEGAGVVPQCFSSANISPVNTGPFTGYASLLYWASEVRKDARVCAILINVPGLNDGYLAAIERWKKITGKTLTAFDNSLGVADDPTPAVAKMKRAGCDAVAFNANEPQVLPVVTAAIKQKAWKGVDWVTLTSGFTTAVGSAVAKAGGAGLFANSEYEPFTESSAATAQWQATMKRHGVALSSFAEGGYLSAKIAVAALESIDGDVTRASFTAALHRVTAFRNGLLGAPYSFAPGDAHNSNRASKFVEVGSDGRWKPLAGGFVTLPNG